VDLIPFYVEPCWQRRENVGE